MKMRDNSIFGHIPEDRENQPRWRPVPGGEVEFVDQMY
jgi:hypothetical protein